MPETVRFVQFNALNSGDIETRYSAFRESIVSLQPDVVGFQEVIDAGLLHQEMEKLGLKHFRFSVPRTSSPTGEIDFVAIASKYPFVGALQRDMRYPSDLLYSSIQVGETIFNVFTTHPIWGFENDGLRLKRAYYIDMQAQQLEKKHPGSISVLTADLNAEPDTRSIRFLDGKDLGPDNVSSTLWVDAHDMAGTPDNWITSDGGGNSLSRKTALAVGISQPDYLPKRRIDYIKVRGWKYGRSGTPVNFGYVEHPEGVELSDHRGIWADLAIF